MMQWMREHEVMIAWSLGRSLGIYQEDGCLDWKYSGSYRIIKIFTHMIDFSLSISTVTHRVKLSYTFDSSLA